MVRYGQSPHCRASWEWGDAEGTQAGGGVGTHTQAAEPLPKGLPFLGPGLGRDRLLGAQSPDPGSVGSSLTQPSSVLAGWLEQLIPSLSLSFPAQPGGPGLVRGGQRVRRRAPPSGAPPGYGTCQESLWKGPSHSGISRLRPLPFRGAAGSLPLLFAP